MSSSGWVSNSFEDVSDIEHLWMENKRKEIISSNTVTSKLKKVAFSENDYSNSNLRRERSTEKASYEIFESYLFDSEKNDKLPIPIRSKELPISLTHEVVDVVPKPFRAQYGIDYEIPDQTIGIPITNFAETPIMHEILPSNHQTRKNTETIHYPLISANIPAYSSIIERKLVKTTMKNESMEYTSSHNVSGNSHQHSFMKKENAEKNKVKFSNTVTVVQVSNILLNKISYTVKIDISIDLRERVDSHFSLILDFSSTIFSHIVM